MILFPVAKFRMVHFGGKLLYLNRHGNCVIIKNNLLESDKTTETYFNRTLLPSSLSAIIIGCLSFTFLMTLIIGIAISLCYFCTSSCQRLPGLLHGFFLLVVLLKVLCSGEQSFYFLSQFFMFSFIYLTTLRKIYCTIYKVHRE